MTLVDITDDEDDIAETIRREDVEEWAPLFIRGLLYGTGLATAFWIGIGAIGALIWAVWPR